MTMTVCTIRVDSLRYGHTSNFTGTSWLVDLVGAYNRGQLPSTVYHEVQEFLTDTSTAPCTYRATRKESEIEATKAYTCM